MAAILCISSSVVVFADSTTALVDRRNEIDFPALPVSDGYPKAWIYKLPNGQYFCVCHSSSSRKLVWNTMPDAR